MKTVPIEIEDKINELLDVLDKDIENVEKNLSRLNELRSLVIKRDETNLGKLLETIRIESGGDTANELRRASIRRELAQAFGCSAGEVTLTRLGEILVGEQRSQILDRKTRLVSVTNELKREHLSTAMLLSECARFNSLLLKNIFDISKSETVTYNSTGGTKRQTETAFMNLQF